MKIDCNITDNFFRELDRMCESCARCDQCELKELKGKYQTLECSTLGTLGRSHKCCTEME